MVTVTDYVDVHKRAKELNCRIPVGLTILPKNFESAKKKTELLFDSDAITVRKLFRLHSISESPLENEGERFSVVQQNDFTWIGPILFYTASVLTQNPELVSTSLGVISNYLTDIFRGTTGKRRVVLDVVIEQTRTRSCTKIHFDGDVEGLADVPKAVTEILKHGKENAAIPGGSNRPIANRSRAMLPNKSKRAASSRTQTTSKDKKRGKQS